MPTYVNQIFQGAGKEVLGQVKWGQKINCNAPGVYVVAMTNYVDKMICCDEAQISKKFVNDWVNYVPKILLDNSKPKTEELVKRLKMFWIPDETILYIGKAGTSLKTRVDQYYRTKLGDPKPHRGGHWIKTLENLSDLNIFWTTSEGETAHDVEDRFLNIFVQNVSQESKKILLDPDHPFPFANLEYPKGTRKNHGLQNQANE